MPTKIDFLKNVSKFYLNCSRKFIPKDKIDEKQRFSNCLL